MRVPTSAHAAESNNLYRAVIVDTNFCSEWKRIEFSTEQLEREMNHREEPRDSNMTNKSVVCSGKLQANSE